MHGRKNIKLPVQVVRQKTYTRARPVADLDVILKWTLRGYKGMRGISLA